MALRAAQAIASLLAAVPSGLTGCRPSAVELVDAPVVPSSPSGSAAPAPSSEPLAAAAPEETSLKRCQAIVNAAFSKDDPYPGEKQNVSAEVRHCCAKLIDTQGSAVGHRWACCVNAEAMDGSTQGRACTPWGPPMPPRMRA